MAPIVVFIAVVIVLVGVTAILVITILVAVTVSSYAFLTKHSEQKKSKYG
jgi:hypothetical protein